MSMGQAVRETIEKCWDMWLKNVWKLLRMINYKDNNNCILQSRIFIKSTIYKHLRYAILGTDDAGTSFNSQIENSN